MSRAIKKQLLMIIGLVSICLLANAQGEKHIRNGNEFYEEQAYQKAVKEYQKAIKESPEQFNAHFNLADAYFHQKRDSLAKDHFSQALNNAKDRNQRADAYYNLGNVELRNKKYKEAISHFQKALSNKPGFANAQYNLSYAMKKLQEEEKNKKSQKPENKDQNKQSEEQNNGQDQQNKDQNQSQNQQQNPPQKPEPSNKGEQTEGKEPELTEEQLDAMLQASRRQEKEIQKRIMQYKLRAKPKHNQKQW
ncbi:MAG: tetratricopeptide repeat protein [Bacteroidetes bacterium]|nr:tetratricopeptide repeat protein [Bacteroidota bacterium]